MRRSSSAGRPARSGPRRRPPPAAGPAGLGPAAGAGRAAGSAAGRRSVAAGRAPQRLIPLGPQTCRRCPSRGGLVILRPGRFGGPPALQELPCADPGNPTESGSPRAGDVVSRGGSSRPSCSHYRAARGPGQPTDDICRSIANATDRSPLPSRTNSSAHGGTFPSASRVSVLDRRVDDSGGRRGNRRRRGASRVRSVGQCGFHCGPGVRRDRFARRGLPTRAAAAFGRCTSAAATCSSASGRGVPRRSGRT